METFQTIFDRAANRHGGEEALRLFYDEVCTARPALLDQLAARGLLRRRCMDLAALRQRHFPGASAAISDKDANGDAKLSPFSEQPLRDCPFEPTISPPKCRAD